jgi:cytochrome c oxidase subunit IV
MSEHIVSRSLYFAIFAALIVLTGITVWVAFIDLGRLNIIVALTIAVFKGLLVVLYFMHVRFSTRLTWVVVAGGFFWLGIMIVLTMSDYVSRGWIGSGR